jgi:hypothetical protein
LVRTPLLSLTCICSLQLSSLAYLTNRSRNRAIKWRLHRRSCELSVLCMQMTISFGSDLIPTGDLKTLVAEGLLFGTTQFFRVCWILYDVTDVKEFHVMQEKFLKFHVVGNGYCASLIFPDSPTGI